jgi:hypothetical protein
MGKSENPIAYKVLSSFRKFAGMDFLLIAGAILLLNHAPSNSVWAREFVFGYSISDIVTFLLSLYGLIRILIDAVTFVRNRCITFGVEYCPLLENDIKFIGMAVRWKHGNPIIIHWLTLVCYAEIGNRHYVVSPQGATLSASNQQQLFKTLDEYPNDKILGVAVQDSNGKWHYSKGFPKDKKSPKK